MLTMKLLPSGETRITRSNRLNRSRCNVLRVLTNPEYLLTFMLTYRFSWSFIELPPREVLEQKLEGSGGDCTGTARCSYGRGMIGLFEHQLSPATIWKFQIVRCAMIKRLLIEPAPEKRLYSGNCGFTVPTIRNNTFYGSVNKVLTKILT